jgi:hypothetical protein
MQVVCNLSVENIKSAEALFNKIIDCERDHANPLRLD